MTRANLFEKKLRIKHREARLKTYIFAACHFLNIAKLRNDMNGMAKIFNMWLA